MHNGPEQDGQLPSCAIVIDDPYLITYRQEVVVGPEGSRADRIQLGRMFSES